MKVDIYSGAQPSELFLQALRTVAEQSSANDHLRVTS